MYYLPQTSVRGCIFFSLLFLAKEIYGHIAHAFWREPFLPRRKQPLIEILRCLAQEAAHGERRQL